MKNLSFMVVVMKVEGAIYKNRNIYYYEKINIYEVGETAEIRRREWKVRA